MRLIDADALEKRFGAKIDEWRGNGPLPSMESLMWIAAKEITDDAPTIEAIPVKWLMDLANRGDFVYGAVTRWKYEQEAREWLNLRK